MLARPLVAGLLALGALGVTATAAAADQQTAQTGPVRAVFSFDRVSDYQYANLRLTIARNGATPYDQPVRDRLCDDACWPGGFRDRRSVHVRDLDGDGEPEVVLDLFSGGAHCCVVAHILSWDGSGYREVRHDFADPGYRLRDLNRDGRLELVTADARFAYLFASFAGSGMPLQVFDWRAGRLVDVTRRHRRAIRTDARRWLRLYRRATPGGEPQGVLAAWVADECLLGRRHAALRYVRRQVRSGKLRAMPGRRHFVRRLNRVLRRFGY